MTKRLSGRARWRASSSSTAADQPKAVRAGGDAASSTTTRPRWWNRWLGRSTYHGRWQEMVTRSAMTLKLMQYAPTGAIVAAPTAGLPEQVGGERNWDYRYTWIRDSSFSIYALLGLGYVEEAAAFLQWLRDRVQEQAGGGDGSGPLKIMYRVDGSSDLTEETLDHFEGYRGSHPVRIGNDASSQLQLDIYGEAMDSIHLADQRGLQIGLRGLAEAHRHARLAVRQLGPARRGHLGDARRPEGLHVRAVHVLGRARPRRSASPRSTAGPRDVERWTKERDRVYEQVMQRGWDPKRKAFVQSYGSDTLDASLLLMPLLGFVSPMEPRWTLDARRDGRDARLRQPRLPVRPERLARRAARLGGHVLAVHLLLRRRARPLRAARRGAAHVREDVHLRQPPRPVLRGDRPDGRAARQLPAGVQPPGADQRGDEPRLPARARRGQRRRAWIEHR